MDPNDNNHRKADEGTMAVPVPAPNSNTYNAVDSHDRHIGDKSKEGRLSSTASPGGAVTEHTTDAAIATQTREESNSKGTRAKSSNCDAQQQQQDAAVKQRLTRKDISLPGAYSSSNHSTTAALESKNAAKKNAHGDDTTSTNAPGAHSLLSTLKDRVIAKGRKSGTAGVGKPTIGSGSVPGAHASLSSMEDRLVTKRKVSSCSAAHATLTSFENQLSLPELEQKFATNEMSKNAAQVKYDIDDVTRITQVLYHEQATVAQKQSSHGLSMMVDDNVSDMSKSSAKEREFSESTYGHQDGSGRQKHDLDMEYGEYGGPDNECLAVAFTVEEDDGGMDIPSAVEYDPDVKPPMYRNRRFRLCFCMGVFAVILATVSLVVGIHREDYTPPPSLAERAVLGIRENVEYFVGTAALEDASSPYSRALDWIQNVDEMALTPNDPTFLQRYVMAYIYFATSIQRPWAGGCSPSNDPDESTTCFFERLRGIEKEYTSSFARRWLSPGTECAWAGVVCDESNQVSDLDLSGTNMTGTFPEGIMLLRALHHLNLGVGELQGTIPERLGSMKHLVKIELYYNKLTGPIPESLYQSHVLQYINVGGNKLKGQISTAVSELKDLKGYLTFENQITGSIPRELFDLPSLVHLFLSDNLITGSIHTEIGRLTQIVQVFLTGNNITSTIPTEIGLLSVLLDFGIGGNQITGSIPEEIANLAVLEKFIADHNQLTGVVPSRIGNLGALKYLNVGNNLLRGTVPTEIGLLKKLISFTGSGNSLTGSVPNEVCWNRIHPGQSGSNRRLEEMKMDCAAAADGVAEIVCPENCCTVCCDSRGTDCKDVNVD